MRGAVSLALPARGGEIQKNSCRYLYSTRYKFEIAIGILNSFRIPIKVRKACLFTTSTPRARMPPAFSKPVDTTASGSSAGAGSKRSRELISSPKKPIESAEKVSNAPAQSVCLPGKAGGATENTRLQCDLNSPAKLDVRIYFHTTPSELETFVITDRDCIRMRICSKFMQHA